MYVKNVINTFPTEKPRRSRYRPPPEGRSPGAEGTATGASSAGACGTPYQRSHDPAAGHRRRSWVGHVGV